jgi:hypothetical protein
VSLCMQTTTTHSHGHGGAMIQSFNSNMSHDARNKTLNHSCCNNIMSRVLKFCVFEPRFSVYHCEYHTLPKDHLRIPFRVLTRI